MYEEIHFVSDRSALLKEGHRLKTTREKNPFKTNKKQFLSHIIINIRNTLRFNQIEPA